MKGQGASLAQFRKTLLNGFLGVATSGLVLSVTGMVGFNYFARDWVNEQLRPGVERELTRSLKRKVALGPVTALLPWRMELGTSAVQNLGTVQAVAVGFSPWDLLSKRPIPLSLALIEPDVLLERDRAGRWAIEDLFVNLEPTAGAVVVERVTVQSGRVRVRSARTAAFNLVGVQGDFAGLARVNFNLKGTLDGASWE
ncbi:hypothetical protein, partial [Candidatus Cyanaurora vandensis]